MNKNKYIAILTAIIIIAIFSGCTEDKQQYFSKRFNETLVLYSDSSFTFISSETYDVSGTYRIDNDDLVLIFPPFGATERMKIERNRLTYHGSEWTKI